MKNKVFSDRYHEILMAISNLPHKIVTLHSHDSLPALVLNTVCSKECFDIKRAAYIVNNPDFNCLKGIVGIDQSSVTDMSQEHAWQAPDELLQRLHRSSFHNLVAGYSAHEALRDTTALAEHLSMHNSRPCRWRMKYNNEGIVLYEPGRELSHEEEEMLQRSLSLLSFCPIT